MINTKFRVMANLGEEGGAFMGENHTGASKLLVMLFL